MRFPCVSHRKTAVLDVCHGPKDGLSAAPPWRAIAKPIKGFRVGRWVSPIAQKSALSGRGRDASYLAPPAQIRTCSFPAYGSHLGYPRQRYAAVCEPASLTRLCGAESGACVAGPHSPWSPPFAPPAPQRLAPPRIAPQRFAQLCSSASQLLWRSATSRVRASSAKAPHLPDADRPSHSTLTAGHEISQLPTRSFCA